MWQLTDHSILVIVCVWQTMGVLQLPFMAVWTCVRGAALALIISYGLWLKVWRSLQPSLTPILDIYHSIDLALVNLITIAEQIVKVRVSGVCGGYVCGEGDIYRSIDMALVNLITIAEQIVNVWGEGGGAVCV